MHTVRHVQGPPAANSPVETGRTLGQGAYATVKEAVRISDGEKLAVKVIAKSLMRGKAVQPLANNTPIYKGREHMILNE